MNSYVLLVLGIRHGSKKLRGNLSYYAHTESWAAKQPQIFLRALLLRSYDRKTPWFRVVPIRTLGFLIKPTAIMSCMVNTAHSKMNDDKHTHTE